MNLSRRTLIGSAAAALALTALPLQLPTADARKSLNHGLATRRYRKLRRLLRKKPPIAGLVNKMLAPSTQRGGYLRLSVTHPRQRSSWLSTAHAQVALEPIVVTAPMILDPGIGSLFGSIGSNQQFFQILRFQIAMMQAQQAALAAQQAAQQAALVNVMVVPPAEPEPTIIEPEPTFIPPVVEPEPEAPTEPSLSDPLRDNPYAQYVASALEDVGLTLAEAFALAVFVGETGGVLADAVPALLEINVQAIATEMAAGNLVARIALTAAGFTVQWIVVGGVLLGTLAVIGITLYYVLPEIDRQMRANVSDFALGEVVIEAAPVAEPEPEPVNNFPDYPWWWDEENGAWVYIGE